MRRAAAKRGFTLVEMMVAVLVGTLGVVMAAQVAQTVLRQNARGKEQNDFSSRARLLGRQLRTDLRVAGIGATGAVAVDTNVAPFNQMAAQTPVGGYAAIPVVAGANNITGIAVGGTAVRDGSDAIQLVVPNPMTMQRTDDRSEGLTSRLKVPTPADFASCKMIYIVDHSAPNGAGRAQVAFFGSVAADGIDIIGNLQFSVSPDSDAMCARVSTYWVDTIGWLHRSDLTNDGNVVQPSTQYPLWIPTVPSEPDLVAPGTLDLQIAYRVSAEAYRLRGQGTTNVGQWAFAGATQNADALLQGTNTDHSGWFEARLVRVNILGRTMRKIQETNAPQKDYARPEDGVSAGNLQLPHALYAEWITTTETLTNLRYFDYGSPENVPAEPY